MQTDYYIHEEYLRGFGFYDSIIKIKSDKPALLEPIVSMDKPCLKMHYEFSKATVYISVNKYEVLVEIENNLDYTTISVLDFTPDSYDDLPKFTTLMHTIFDMACPVQRGAHLC